MSTNYKVIARNKLASVFSKHKEAAKSEAVQSYTKSGFVAMNLIKRSGKYKEPDPEWMKN
jgi:hypothetical protein